VNVLTTCPFCGCGCGVVVEVEYQRVVAVFPQRSHPGSKGTLCSKGWNGHQFIHHPERITQPLIKENNAFKPVSWARALHVAADGLQRIRDRYGAAATAVIGSLKCTNEELYLLTRFSRTVLETPNLDTAMRLYHSPTVRAFLNQGRPAAATVTFQDLSAAAVVLVIGAEPKFQNSRIGALLLEAARNGRTVILLDPHTQEHSIFYSQHLRLKPQTDLHLLYAVMHEILDRGWFASASTAWLKMKDSLSRFSCDAVAKVCGVAAKEISVLAERFATAKTGVIVYGNGLTQQANGVQCVRALLDLATMTDKIDKPGCGILPLFNPGNMQGSIDMGMAAELLPGHNFLTDEAAASHVSHMWKTKLPHEPGLTLQEMVDHAGSRVRAMYVVGENLMRSAMRPERLRQLDFLVVQDLFLTETAQAAHVVLPACSFAEKEGTVTSMERRVQRLNRAILPLGESKPDYEIITLLAKELGADWPLATPAALFAELAAAVPEYSGLNYNSFAAAGGAIWTDDRGKLSKSLFSLAEPAALVEPMDADFPFTLIIGRGRIHRHTGTLLERSFTLAKEEPQPVVEVHADDARAMKLRSGWNVLIRTRHGELVRQVVVSSAVAPGTIFIPLHEKGSHALSLLSPTLEPVSKIPLMKSCAARLEAV
jgi:predicted molibdopterin-dependent oxidoreductase YjgC